jgi:preprotein translocase subunit YajC
MGGFGFLLIIVAFAFLYLVLVRPQKRRQLAQQRMLDHLEVGDEIVTAGGMYGEITKLHDDELRVRIAPQVEVRVARRAVAGVTPRELEDEAGSDVEADAEAASER